MIKKGYLEADFDKEKEIAEFFGIDLGQAEKERIELVRSFSIAVPIDIFAIQGEIEGMPELNANGVNKKIKAHIFSDEKMRMMGFTDHCKDRWYFCKMLELQKKGGYDCGISFSVTIPKDGSDIRIDVLDEWACQPYDYQRLLAENPRNTVAKSVNEQVEAWMEELQKAGILEGHVRGEYI